MTSFFILHNLHAPIHIKSKDLLSVLLAVRDVCYSEVVLDGLDEIDVRSINFPTQRNHCRSSKQFREAPPKIIYLSWGKVKLIKLGCILQLSLHPDPEDDE